MDICKSILNSPGLFTVTIITSACCIVFLIYLVKLNSEIKSLKSVFALNPFIDSIHAGLVKFMTGDTCTIQYASKGFYELLGYMNKEENPGLNLIDFIYSKDRDGFVKRINMNDSLSISMEVRLVKRDGFVIYCLMDGRYETDQDGKKSVSAVFVDVTEKKKEHEMLRMDRERYKIAAELSNDILFEYYIDTDTMVYNNRYKKLFGRELVIHDFVKNSMKRNDYVHPDDYGLFLEFCSKLAEGSDYVSTEMRFKRYHKDYIWCQIMGKTIYDDDKKPNRVMGKIINIDYQKRELDALEYKATRDPLTGIYNREITIKKIDQYINGNKEGKHALLFIDFDDFKKVNDNYGHLLGDRVLIYVINKIKSVFTEGEIIGRVGGDEFLVFIGYINSEEEITRKANSLITTLNTTYKDEEHSIDISCSIGIAMYPEDGIHYAQLIQCADKALYYVKSRGKNNFIFYKHIT